MRLSALETLMAALAVAGATGAVQAQPVVPVTSDITVSTTWTANNRYNLVTQIYVTNGATLTIQPGTVIASTPTMNGGGALAVTRGSKIFVQGTKDDPVIFTSTNDTATWIGGDPTTGTWREAASEWGNLTLMGNGYISSCERAANTAAPSGNNVAAMEGLTEAFPGDPRVLYGGGNDNDDSGTLTYMSIRYGGRVIGLADELNGLSLGGIGRNTDLHHVEIMNNVDDGIEVWGGAVNIKWFSIWNIGDDCFDVDQGWRGKAQFGLLVQGYSVDAAQGSGVGDNGFETDGAEDASWQPVTTATIYNCTFVGQPLDGDHATAWRDNARVQYRNSIFMDCGEEVVRADNEGDHTCAMVHGTTRGYGALGTLSWLQTWSTPYTQFSTVNPPANPGVLYQAQTSGNLAEISDSVFFNNGHASAYTTATAVGVFAPANNNVTAASSPIASITRAAPVVKGGKAMVRVTMLDPRPAGDALTSVNFAPNDGFFGQAKYRGAFPPGVNWLNGWTAAAAYDMTPEDTWCDLGNARLGINGDPVLAGAGTFLAGQPIQLRMRNGRPSSVGTVVIGFSRLDLPYFGAVFVPFPNFLIPLPTDGAGNLAVNFPWPSGVPSGLSSYYQVWVVDPAAPFGLSVSNALSGTTP